MTNWGDYDSHIRVGIDWSISPANPSHSDTSVKVTWQFYVGVNQTFDDDETLVASGTGFGATSTGFHNGLASGGSKLVWTHSETYDIDYNSGNVSASCHITGAYNGSGASNSVTVNLPNRPKAAPSHPTWDDPDITAITQTTANMHGVWGNDNGGDPANTMECQVAKDSGFTTGAFKTDSGTAVVDVTGLTASTTYYARLRTQNSIGWSDWSGTRSFTTADPPAASQTAPNAPVMNTPAVISQSQINTSWSTPANGGAALDDVDTQIALDSGFTNVIGDWDPSSWGNSLAWISLTPSTTYYFRVRAHNSIGWSAWSAGVSATTNAAASSNPPSQPSVPTVSSTTATTAKVSFTPPNSPDSPITSYDFEWSTDSTFATGTTVNEPSSTASPLTLSSLPSNTTLYVRFRANNANGSGPWSAASASFHTQVFGTDGTLVQKISALATAIGSSLASALSRITALENHRTGAVNGFVFDTGTVSLASSTAGTDTSTTVSFNGTFAHTPVVLIVDNSSKASTVNAAYYPDTVTTTSFHAHVIASNTAGHPVRWVAFDPTYMNQLTDLAQQRI